MASGSTPACEGGLQHVREATLSHRTGAKGRQEDWLGMCDSKFLKQGKKNKTILLAIIEIVISNVI